MSVAVAAEPGVMPHPAFPIRDANGVDVVQSGLPYDPTVTCGSGCHDTEYIVAHATHGADELGQGPMDCAICHLAGADLDARRSALDAGRADLAATATLTGAGVVVLDPGSATGVRWTLEALEDGGFPSSKLGPTTSERCGSCHGTVYFGAEPMRAPDGQRSRTTGLIFSGQRVDESALNLEHKDELTRSWDVHAERLLDCTSCHFSSNHPAQRQEGEGRPAHLRFDPRTTPLADYLSRPSHTLARGDASAPMRRCDGCHDAEVGHDFLPDRGRHFAALACEVCHIPFVPWGPLQQLDETAVDAKGRALEDWRGTDSTPDDLTALQAGYQPILLSRLVDNAPMLSPFHLSTRWRWESAGVPVSLETVAAVFSEPTLLAAFDDDHDGVLSDVERRLDTRAAAELVAGLLRAHGVAEPTIVGVVDAFPVSHGVVRGPSVTRVCTDCHGANSRLDRGLLLAAWTPGDVQPTLGKTASALLGPESIYTEDGALWARPSRSERYVFGADRLPWLDRLGLFAVMGAIVFAAGHGGLRYLTHKNSSEKTP